MKKKEPGLLLSHSKCNISHTCVGFLLRLSAVLNDSPKGIRPVYSQLSISRVQFCSSRGYLLRSIIHAAVVVILKKKTPMGEERKYCVICAVVNVTDIDSIDRRRDSEGDFVWPI